MSESREKYLALIVKYLAKETSLSEEEMLFEWLSRDPEHQALFDQTEGIWNKTSRIAAEEFTPNVDLAWSKLKGRIGHGQTVSAGQGETKVIKLFSPSIFRFAASVAIILTLSAIAFFYMKQADQTEVQLAALDKKTRFSLPDSSQVWLSPGSRLTFIQNFNGETREVKLEGEGFFDVKRNEAKPFIVLGQTTKTQVLGTSFFVHAKSGDPLEFVQVSTGKVQFSEVANSSNSLTLKAGDKARFLPNKALELTSRQPLNADAFKTNHLAFDNTSLKEVLEDIQTYFGEPVQVDNEAILNCHFTGNFQDPTLEGVLIVLTLSTNSTYHKEGGGYVLKGAGCN